MGLKEFAYKGISPALDATTPEETTKIARRMFLLFLFFFFFLIFSLGEIQRLVPLPEDEKLPPADFLAPLLALASTFLKCGPSLLSQIEATLPKGEKNEVEKEEKVTPSASSVFSSPLAFLDKGHEDHKWWKYALQLEKLFVSRGYPTKSYLPPYNLTSYR
jgi:hypothetical protein